MELSIKVNPLPIIYEKKLLKYLIIPGNYIHLNEEQEMFIKKKIKKYNNEYNLLLNINMVLSIRSSYMNEKMMFNSSFLKRKSKKLFKSYKNGVNILELSKKYDFSPVSILREILKRMNISNSNIKDILRFKQKYKLDDRLTENIKLATENDIYNKMDHTESVVNSENFEEQLGQYLNKKGIKFKTQNMLVDEQIEQYGRPISTPDFLIESELKINKQAIKWIDAKNFYGANTKITKNNIKKQTEKYIKNYGSGAIVFSLNFSEELNFDNVILLNYNLMK